MATKAVILAAGRGTRMHSGLAKALHEVGGIPLVEHVVRAVLRAGLGEPLVVVGFQGDRVEERLEGQAAFVTQPELLGTGDAVCRALDVLSGVDHVLVVVGDCPLVPSDLLAELVRRHEASGAAATLVTTELPDPSGYGRVVRSGDGSVSAIVEEREASDVERRIREINTGIGVWRVQGLREILETLPLHNAERYLTEAIGVLRAQGERIDALTAPDPGRVIGINTRRQLAEAEQVLKRLVLERLFAAGVTVVDPDSTFVDPTVEVGQDTVLYPMTVIRGHTKIGRRCRIGPMTTIVESRLGDEVVVNQSVVEQSVVLSFSSVGPMSHLRPASHLDPEVHVGNFVELKNTRLGTGTKVGHHSYLGDATVGSGVNIGAGTVVVNYDGQKKHPTFIGDSAFIGCNANLVAPVEIGPGAFVAAGSTVTQNVPADALAVARARQEVKAGWAKARRAQE